MEIFHMTENSIHFRSADAAERALISRWSRGKAFMAGSGITRQADGIKFESIAINFQQPTPPKPHKRFEFRWAWFDLWVGAYIDRPNKAVYICPLPTLAFRISYA